MRIRNPSHSAIKSNGKVAEAVDPKGGMWSRFSLTTRRISAWACRTEASCLAWRRVAAPDCRGGRSIIFSAYRLSL